MAVARRRIALDEGRAALADWREANAHLAGSADRGVPAEAIFVSLERSMKCAIRLCGHCQLGPEFICHDGPVFAWDRVEPLLKVREL